MTRPLTLGALVACLLTVTSMAARQQPVFRGTGEAVRVFVTVLDGDGRLVTTLTQDVFEVRDEGKAQPITLFDNTPQPIRLIVMLDVSGSMEGNLPLLRASTEQLFRRLRADDAARVGAFGRDVVIGPTFTGNPDRLEEQLPRRIEPEAPTPLWRALDQAMDAFGTKGAEDDARRVILVLSDGKDSGPIGITPGNNLRKAEPSQAGVIDRALKDEVMVYAIGMRSRSRQPMQPGVGASGLTAMLADDLPDPGLARVAEETGGGYKEVKLGEDLGAAFARVADELHSQYLLGFAPPKRDGKAHGLDVKVSKKGLKPRARTSYIAPKG